MAATRGLCHLSPRSPITPLRSIKLELEDGAQPGLPAEAMDLGRVEVPDAPEVLAALLRSKILSGELAEGSALPTERSLVEQTRLSRATVREALRILQIQGLVARRVGRGGGSIVARPGTEDIVGWLDIYLEGRRLDTTVLLEAREIIEPWCAALAAERRSDADLEILDGWNRQMWRVVDDLPAYLQSNVGWHIAVADAGRNELIGAVMHALGNALLRQTGGEHFNTDEVRASAIRAHEAVTEAIRARDPESARRRMARHVHGFATAILQAGSATSQ